MSELVDACILQLHRARDRNCAFRDDDDREAAPGIVPLPETVAHFGDVERRFGNEDHVGATRHSRRQRDPARVPPHHLHDHDAVMAFSGGVQAVDRVRRDLHRRVVPEGHVVVDHGDESIVGRDEYAEELLYREAVADVCAVQHRTDMVHVGKLHRLTCLVRKSQQE